MSLDEGRHGGCHGKKVSVRAGSYAIALAFLIASTGAAVCAPSTRSAARHVELRIYDSVGQAKWEVRTPDVVRSSARASRQPGGVAALYFRLTTNGAFKFHSLTRALARRGTRLHRSQRFAFEVDGRVYARPFIDYRASPNGLDGRSGIQVGGLKLATAQRLARGIRQG